MLGLPLCFVFICIPQEQAVFDPHIPTFPQWITFESLQLGVRFLS